MLGAPAIDDEIQRIAKSARVAWVSAKNPKEGEPRALRRLAFGMETKEDIAELLRVRRKLYAKHYEASDKLIVDDMLCHAVYYSLRQTGALDRREDPDLARLQREILQRVLLLTDDDLVPALVEIGAPDAARRLFTSVREHNYYVPVLSAGVGVDDVNFLNSLQTEWAKRVKGFTDQLPEAQGATEFSRLRRSQDLTSLLAELRPVLEASDKQHARRKLFIFMYQANTNGRFLKKTGMERRCWNALMRQPNAEKIFLEFVSYEHADGVDREREYREECERFPPIHITTGSSFSVKGEEDLEQHTKEGPSAPVVLYGTDEAGRPRIEESQIRVDISRAYEGYPFVVSVPPSLRDAASVDTLVSILHEELFSLNWLL
jgi:hypothetical protein